MRGEMIAARLVRLLRLVELLQKQPFTRRELAEYFRISERRIQEDLRILRRAGIPVSRTSRGYTLARRD